MKRMSKAAAWLSLMVMIALSPFLLASQAAEREKLIRKDHDSWAGVLRLWKYEGWQAGNGSLTTWLNACIERFEKRNPGVYVQMTEVSEETMAFFAEGSVNPPDMILFAPGLLEAPYHLMEMERDISVREAVSGLGIWQGVRYAVPVALGGYALAINSKLLPETPTDWSEQQMPEGKKKEKIDLLNVPSDGPYRSWSAALISLFAGRHEGQQGTESAPVGEGIDLGLAIGEPAETARRNLQGELVEGRLPSVLPEDFRASESVYSQFTAGKIAAMPVTQREVRRLQLLSETGKAPDWRAEAAGLPFTDQAALFSVVAWPRSDAQERQGLCMELMGVMLSEEMQGKLTASRAFPVIELPPMYQNQEGMREIEKALSRDDLLTPPAFGDEWREYADRLMDEADAGEGMQEAYEQLHALLSPG